MASVKAKDTEPERILRRALWARGHRYRLYPKGVMGKPDLVFVRARMAVFVDGDFWHGRLIQEGRTDAFAAQFRERAEWWLAKVERNIGRDIRVTDTLQTEGWTVVRVWESDIRNNLDSVVRRIEATLERGCDE